MWNAYFKKVTVFVIVFIFLLCPLYSTKSFETKQSVFFNWSIDITDLDQSCNIPYERYSFHQLIKSETHEGCIYLARGSEKPTQLVCISSIDGSVLWDYTQEKKLNIDVPFVITETSILINYTNEIHVISKEDGTLYRILDSTVLPKNSQSIFKNENYIITEVKSNSINCFNCQDTKLQWAYEFPSNCTYRILGIIDETLFMLEQTEELTELKGIQISSGVEEQIASWDNTLLRIDAVITDNNIELGVLQKDGSFSITKIEIEGLEKYKTTEIVVNEKVQSLEILEDTNSSLLVETNLIGFRFLINHNKYYLINSTQESDKTGHTVTLSVICCTNDGSTIWNHQYKSVESTDSIVEDLLIQDDFIVFQFSYRESLTMDIEQSFWLKLETGSIIQAFYDNINHWKEIGDQGMQFFHNAVIFTSTPDSLYLTSIVGYSFVNTGFYNEEIKEVELQNVEVQEIWKKSFTKCTCDKVYSPFEYDHCICFFALTRNTGSNLQEKTLYKYDMVTKTELPPISFPNFQGLSKDVMLLKGDLLTVSSKSSYYRDLTCYNLKTGETVWKKEAQVICNVGENFLTIKNTGKGSILSLTNGIDGSEIWKYSSDNNQVSFCGIDKNNHVYFKRNSSILIQLNLETGLLEDEILLSFPDYSYVYIKDNYMIFETGYNTFRCLYIPTKKVLWTKNLVQYSECFIKTRSSQYECAGKMINENEMLTFNKNSLIVFNLKTGTPSIRYNIAHYKIDSIEELQDNTFFLDVDGAKNNAKIIHFDVNKPDSGTTYVFPEKEDECYNDSIMGHFKYKDETFFMQQCANDVFKIGLANSSTLQEETEPTNVRPKCTNGIFKAIAALFSTPEEETEPTSIPPSSLQEETEPTNTAPSTSEEEIEPTNIKPECTNFLYYKDYIVFQASLGTKNSNFYLLAFNTLDGTITQIHRGMHDKFFIYKNMLYFVQHEDYYSCTFGEFKPTRTSYSFNDPKFISDGDKLELINYQENIPKEYKVLDLYYINQVLTGSFSKPSIDETLFLTGDFNYSKVGIIEKQTKLFAPVIHGCLELEHSDSNGETFLTFWQSMIADVDNDGLDEVVSLNFSKNSAECVVYIWEYSQEEEKMVSHKILNLENISMPELIKKNDKIYLQCSYFIDYSYKLKQRVLKYNPDKPKIFSLYSCKEELTTELYKKPEMPGLSKFQFLENPANGESCLELVETESKGFPLVKMPDKYNVTGNKFAKEELKYIQKRNNYIDSFIELLDSGVDPFEGTWIDLVGYDKASPYNVALRIDEEFDYQSDTIPIHFIDTLIPVKENETEYIVVRAIDILNGRHFFLFSDQFKFLDVVSDSCNEVEYYANTIVNLKNPTHFWFSERMDRGPYRLCFVCVNNSKLNSKTLNHSGYPNLINKDGEPFFLINILHIFIAGPRNSSISGYEYIDPWSGQYVNQLFLEEMKMQLDYLYSCYQYYHADSLTPGRIEGDCNNTITLEDGRKKHLYVSISVSILEQYESVFYRYGWK